MGKHEVDNRPWCDRCNDRVERVFGFELAFDMVNVCWGCLRQYKAGVFK